MITEPLHAEAVIQNGEADAVLMAREFLRDPYFPFRAAHELGEGIDYVPKQYGRAIDLNPLIIADGEPIAVDALVEIREPATARETSPPAVCRSPPTISRRSARSAPRSPWRPHSAVPP